MYLLDSRGHAVQQALLDRPGSDLRARVEVEFGEDVGDVTLGRGHGDDQFLGNLAVRQAEGDELGDPDLTRAQAARVLACLPRPRRVVPPADIVSRRPEREPMQMPVTREATERTVAKVVEAETRAGY